MFSVSQKAKEIHAAAVLKGWYDNGEYSQQDEEISQVLILSELNEVIRAHRTSNWATNKKYFAERIKEVAGSIILKGDEERTKAYNAHFKTLFEAHIKNTVEDEFADAIIRCLDMLGARIKNLTEDSTNWDNIFYNFNPMEQEDSIPKFILKINKLLLNSNFDSRIVITTIREIQWFCERLGFDVEWNIEQKCYYNKLCPRKNGKLY